MPVRGKGKSGHQPICATESIFLPKQKQGDAGPFQHLVGLSPVWLDKTMALGTRFPSKQSVFERIFIQIINIRPGKPGLLGALQVIAR